MFPQSRPSASVPLCVVTFALCLCWTQAGAAQNASRGTPLSPIVSNHFLVVYRNASIPTDVESRTSLAGARVLHRNERLGIAAVETNGVLEDRAALHLLAAQADVDFVVHDRMIYAHQVVVNPINGYRNPLARPLTPLPTRVALPISTDHFYNSPQGWAVRQVGGYGKQVAGGLAHGPWDLTMGKGVRIAILDSGVDANHPDLTPNLALNLTEVDQNPQTGLPSACDDGTPQDQQGHGTWVASLAAGAAGPGTGEVIGVAPEASILNIKVMQRMPDLSVSSAPVAQQCSTGQAEGLVSWVLQGITDALANHADVISMSLGSMVDLSTGDGAGLKALFDRATYAAAQSGAVLVAAAGNDGFDLSNPRYVELPAEARGVLAIVASTNPACSENLSSGAACTSGPVTLPYYSNFGSPLAALAAPGGSLPAGGDNAVSGWVRGACSSGETSTADGLPADSAHSFGCFNLGHTQYVQAMGTSASAPLAAGVAALIRAAHPDWDVPTIIARMLSSATSSTGLIYPQVNAANALGLQE